MSTLLLTPSQADQIRREGCQAYPDECCGVMIGRDQADQRIVDELRPLANSFDPAERYHRFKLDPLELAKVDKEAAAKGKLVLGFYHSHPDHPARPSETDREHAWPFYSYIIVKIAKGTAAEMTSWQLDQQTEQFVPEPIAEREQLR